VPFYLMPSLGGKNTLRGYYDFRFHDRDMQLFNAESRWGLFTHLDVAVFADAGKVAPEARDLDLKQFIFKVNDPFRRSTLSGGRTEVIPFVP
jgi:outer membrane protein assembly factor BamA